MIMILLAVHIATCIWYMLACTGWHQEMPCECENLSWVRWFHSQPNESERGIYGKVNLMADFPQRRF